MPKNAYKLQHKMQQAIDLFQNVKTEIVQNKNEALTDAINTQFSINASQNSNCIYLEKWIYHTLLP